MNPLFDNLVDCLGQPIRPGCFLVYPIRQGARMWVVDMTVEGIKMENGKPTLYGYRRTGQRCHTRNIQNTTVVTPAK